MQIGQIDSDDRDSAVREIGVITEKSELLKKNWPNTSSLHRKKVFNQNKIFSYVSKNIQSSQKRFQILN